MSTAAECVDSSLVFGARNVMALNAPHGGAPVCRQPVGVDQGQGAWLPPAGQVTPLAFAWSGSTQRSVQVIQGNSTTFYDPDVPPTVNLPTDASVDLIVAGTITYTLRHMMQDILPPPAGQPTALIAYLTTLSPVIGATVVQVANPQQRVGAAGAIGPTRNASWLSSQWAQYGNSCQAVAGFAIRLPAGIPCQMGLSGSVLIDNWAPGRGSAWVDTVLFSERWVEMDAVIYPAHPVCAATP